jgi:peptidoglycan/xylan/chitin deacetylase (PgdA/CDA1 family)
MSRITKRVEELGFKYYDWNVSSGDAGGATSKEKVYKNVISEVPKYQSSIVLQHDTHSYSVDAVEDIIKWGLENGYTFKAIDNNTPVVHHGVNN